LFGKIEQRGLRLFRLNEPDGDSYHDSRFHPVFPDQTDYFEKGRRSVADCYHGSVQARGAPTKSSKRARHAGFFSKLPARFAISGTNHLIAVPFKAPWRKPGPNHPRIRIDASAAPQRCNSGRHGIGRKTNSLRVIEIAGRMDNAPHYLPLVVGKAVLTHLFVNDSKTLLLDFTPGLDQPTPSG
jgi:hypothetical protein